MNRRYLLVMLAVCLIIGCVQAWGADFGAWDYRKEITVNNTGSNLTNYQVLFTVNRSAGSDSGFTVYLDGKCESDYDDIRFTIADENTLCDYWIESSSSTVASIWVEVPSIVNSTAYGSTTMYIYYGNSGASAVSDGEDTFPFFDDFPGSSLDTDKWDNIAGSGVAVSGGELTVTAAAAAGYGVGTDSTFTPPYVVEARLKPSHLTTYLEALHSKYIDDSNQCAVYFCHVNSPTNNVFYTSKPGTDNMDAITGDTAGEWNRIVSKVLDSSIKYQCSSPSAGTGSEVTHTTGYPSGAGKLRIVTYASGSVIKCDWVFVRKYTATEPTVSAWGSEEEAQIVNLFPDFSGVPTSGYVPLTVYFSDSSTAENCTINTWEWSFGDSTPNSTQQDPAHTYTTSGLYNVILTVTNTSFSKTNTTQKTAYINVTVNPDAPNADFTTTETCGDTTDTFYFIDFSTGGGLYAWNWSFGDGQYSELRNPTHQYASNGTYDVNLTVWGAYGFDSLLRENLITIPCGAPTPTPTPTATPTGTGNVTEGNATYIYAPDQDYVPFPIWLAIVIVTIALFGHSLIFLKNSDLTAIMASLFAMLSAWLSNMIGYIDVQVTSYAEEIVISPLIQAVHPPWLVYTMLIFAFVSVLNIFAAIYKVYLKPVPWNEIYDRKLPKWERRK